MISHPQTLVLNNPSPHPQRRPQLSYTTTLYPVGDTQAPHLPRGLCTCRCASCCCIKSSRLPNTPREGAGSPAVACLGSAGSLPTLLSLPTFLPLLQKRLLFLQPVMLLLLTASALKGRPCQTAHHRKSSPSLVASSQRLKPGCNRHEDIFGTGDDFDM